VLGDRLTLPLLIEQIPLIGIVHNN
jgi:hypothetical protein